MKKTLTINLSGIVFHIDEDAYEKLGNYLKAIKKSFSDAEGRDEIMADIEARIAEMLQEKVNQHKQVVSIEDINTIINIMGKPEEFGGENNKDSQQNETHHHHDSYYSGKRRRIFRDPEERIFAGVCSGIAAYFGIDPIWLRLAFVICFFCFGSGLMLYLILWVVIPIAKTTAEKLEMRGEPVNIDNIGKSINEEAEHLKNKMNDLKNEINTKENRQRIRNTANQVSNFFVQLLTGVLKTIGKIFAFFFIVIGFLLLVILLASLFGFNTIHIIENGKEATYSLHEFGNIIFNTVSQSKLAIIGGALLLGVPFIRMMYFGFRLLFDIPRTNKMLKFTFRLFWLTGFVMCIYAGVLVARDFNVKASSNSSYPVIQPKTNTLYLTVKQDKVFDDEDFEHTFNVYHKSMRIINHSKWNLISFDEKKIILGPPLLNIVPSETDSFQLIIASSACGESEKDALYRIKKINYSLRQTDSLIEFDNVYELSSEDKWRGQKINLTLKVPKGKMIYMDKSMSKIIYDIKNAGNISDEDMVKRRWIMGNSELKCIDCNGLDVNEDEIGKLPPPYPANPGSEAAIK